jgi:hypothetical protein
LRNPGEVKLRIAQGVVTKSEQLGVPSPPLRTTP